MKKERDSGIELLRIFAMLMVIGVHAFLYGDYFEEACEYEGAIYRSAHFLKLFFRPAVDTYVIITGYFMVHTAFNLKKSYKRLLSMYGVIYFYSIVLGIIFFAARANFDSKFSDFSIFWKMFFPLTSQNWYFLTDYILLCLFAPFINIILQNIEKKDYKILIILLTLLMSIWLSLTNIEPLSEILSGYGYGEIADGKNVFSFIYIYILGGYVGMHLKTRKRPGIIYLVAAFLCVWINYFIWMNFDEVLGYSHVAISYANPLVILTAVFLLLFFKDLHFYSRTVNMLASTTIGIYALHEMEFMRNFIWEKLSFTNVDCSDLTLNILRIITILFAIFLTGAIIELVRQQIFNIIKGLFTIRRAEAERV